MIWKHNNPTNFAMKSMCVAIAERNDNVLICRVMWTRLFISKRTVTLPWLSLCMVLGFYSSFTMNFNCPAAQSQLREIPRHSSNTKSANNEHIQVNVTYLSFWFAKSKINFASVIIVNHWKGSRCIVRKESKDFRRYRTDKVSSALFSIEIRFGAFFAKRKLLLTPIV